MIYNVFDKDKKMNKLYSGAKNTIVDGFLGSITLRYSGDLKAQKNSFLHSNMTTLTDLRKTLNVAILREKVESTLEVCDKARVSDFRTALKFSNVYTSHPDKNIVELNAPVNKILKKYQAQGILTSAYKTKMSLFNSLKTELEPYGENLEKLDAINSLLARLWADEAKFEEENAKFVDAKNSKQESATAIKKNAVNLVNKTLVPFLAGQIVQKDEDTYDFALYVQSEIDRSNESVRALKKTEAKAASEKTENEQKTEAK